MNNYTITIMTMDHYEEVYRLWKTSEGIGLSRADSREDIAKFLERNEGLSFVAIVDNKIIGTILGGHDGRRGFIYHLIVNPGYRSSGIGRALTGRCLERFKKIGIEKSHVFVFRDNTKAIGFWEKIGYKTRKDLSLMSFTIK